MLNKGQSLFEVLFTLAIAAIVLTGIVSVSSSSVGTTTISRESTVAVEAQQEAVEWLRTQRDADWTTFASYSSTGAGSDWCLQQILGDMAASLTTTASCGYMPGTRQTRTINLMANSATNPTSIEAEVRIAWQDPTGQKEDITIIRFTNWSELSFLPSPTPTPTP